METPDNMEIHTDIHNLQKKSFFLPCLQNCLLPGFFSGEVFSKPSRLAGRSTQELALRSGQNSHMLRRQSEGSRNTLQFLLGVFVSGPC